jgi:hypothetical protein
MAYVDAFHPELPRTRGRPVFDHVRHAQACQQQLTGDTAERPGQESRTSARIKGYTTSDSHMRCAMSEPQGTRMWTS